MMTKEIEGVAYELNDTMVTSYFERLTGRIFKIIPISEEDNFHVQPYIASLLREMLGIRDLMEAIDQDERFMQVAGILNYLAENPDIDSKIMKSEVFHALNILKKINRAHIKPAKQPKPVETADAEE